MKIKSFILVLVIIGVRMPLMAQTSEPVNKFKGSHSSATTLPTCDPAFSEGLKALMKTIWMDEPMGRGASYRAVVHCVEKAHLENAPDERVVEEMFRFAYDHRKDQAIVMSPGILTGLVRQYFVIQPRAFANVCMRYLDSPDPDIRNVAERVLDLSGMLDVQIDEAGTHGLFALADFIKRLKPEDVNAISPSFVRTMFTRDPELAWAAFYPLDESEADLSKESRLSLEKRGRTLQDHSEYVHYIMWAMTQTRRETGSKTVDEPLVTVLLRELSKSASRRCDRLFVLGVMDQSEFDKWEQPRLLDMDVLEHLQNDNDPLVKAVAKQVRAIVDVRNESIHRGT